MLNRRNWFLTAGGILAATATPTKAYSFLFNNPLRDDAAWLSKQEIVDGADLMIRSFCNTKAKIQNSIIRFGSSGYINFDKTFALEKTYRDIRHSDFGISLLNNNFKTDCRVVFSDDKTVKIIPSFN